jgi:uncharacterized protein
MVPVHFGRSDRVMFGMFTPAAGKRVRRGAVICNPWGVEAIRAHRSIKALADNLSRLGVDVFRFDYFGTGDSFGDGLSGSLDDWCSDTEQAMDELMSMAGVRKVALIGLRLGAHVAAAVSTSRKREVDRLVLWDPVVNGASYLEDLKQRKNAEAEGVLEMGGYVMSKDFEHQLREAMLDGVAGIRTPVLLALSTAEQLTAYTVPEGVPLTTEVKEGPACWLEERDFGAGAVPVELLRTIGAWVAQN